MSNGMRSTLAIGWDAGFIFAQAGVTNHYGSEVGQDGSVAIGYRVEDGDAVLGAIAAYPVAYLAVALPAKLAAISAERDRRIQSFTFNGMPLPLDDTTLIKLDGAALGLMRNETLQSVSWSLGGGEFAQLPREAVLALADAAFMHVQSLFAAHGRIATIAKAAADIDALAAVDEAQDDLWTAP